MSTRPRWSASVMRSDRHAWWSGMPSRRRVSRVRQQRLDRHVGRSGREVVPRREQLVERAVEVVGREPGHARRRDPDGLDGHRLSAPEAQAGEADAPARRPGPAAAPRSTRPRAPMANSSSRLLRLEAAQAHVLRERGQAEEADDGRCLDVRARAVAPDHEALGDERVGRASDGHPGRVPPLAQLALARQPVTRSRVSRRARAGAHAAPDAWPPPRSTRRAA